jgi:hypothetical protein
MNALVEIGISIVRVEADFLERFPGRLCGEVSLER